ncbi:magnesium/cobalt transporter CorA [bacterium]|nr:magnesium/cobalt transporter CorA [bacterium]MBU1637661.1 magnesium/cobalt transporter CorA [bacterium]MBU1921392.1 magnesium/cobalt transporter CorA [bacterium]
MTQKLRRKNKQRRIPRATLSPGSAPGSLTTHEGAAQTQCYLTATKADGIFETECNVSEDLGQYLNKWPLVWINIEGLADTEKLMELGRVFNLHPLALEDVVNTTQRPKTEHYEGTIFIVLRMVKEYEATINSEQICIFLGKDFVLTLQEETGDCLDPVRKRIRVSEPRIRFSRPAYLMYSLVDAIIDHYFPVLERLGDRIEDLEERIVRSLDDKLLEDIYQVRRDLLKLRRHLWPTREAVDRLYRDPTPLIDDETRIYLRDCYDHCVQLLDLVESYRDISSALMESYRSQVSLNMNEVMKVLTIIATLFIPVTFIAGIYGMNFDASVSPWNMPELRWFFGYLFAWGLMLITGGAFLYYFWKKGWIGGRKRSTGRASDAA